MPGKRRRALRRIDSAAGAGYNSRQGGGGLSPERDADLMHGEGRFILWQVRFVLKYRLDRIVDTTAYYQYFPDGEGRPGIVAIHKVTGETSVEIMSPDDFGNYYAFKLLRRLEAFFESGEYPESGMAAWY